MTAQPTKPVTLFTEETLAPYWPQVEPLLQQAPISKEFTPAEIFNAVVDGRMHIFAFVTESNDVDMIVVLAPMASTILPSYTLVTASGKNLKKHAKQYWEYLKGWCYMNGARAIDAYVPERMEEFMEKELGLKKEMTHVRLYL